MKQTVKQIITLTLALLCIVCLAACQKNTIDAAGLWENATHRGDREFGKGETTVTVEVKAGEDQVTFTLHTDKSTVGEALLEHELIAGEQGAYGLYVKVVNGDQSWTYRYVGAVGVGTMADWIDAYGVTTETVTRVDLQDKARDSEVNDGQIVTFTPHRATVTDAAQIAALLEAMSVLPRDAEGYEAALAATEEPYEGYIRVTLLQSNPDGSVREWGSFVWYPKLGYVNDGYKTDAAFGELLEAMLG